MVRIMKKDGNRLEGIGERIAVRLTLLEEALGMTPGDHEIYGNWIASKAPEPENGAEEVGVIEGMEAVEDATTCFPRTEDGVPFCWDYQIKGFFKDACSSLRRVSGTRSSKLTAFKKVIDGTVFVEQRKIPFKLPDGAECGRCERPLRASSASGERVALAASETVPAGTVLEFSVLVMNPKDAETVREWLDYGRLRGLFQWRNSGKGRFEWEEVESEDNAVDFQFGVDSALIDAAAPKAKAGSYDLAPTGDAGATLNLKAQGDAKNVKEDIAKDKTVATITWTFAAGNAAGGISVDDSWEGNHEMGID